MEYIPGHIHKKLQKEHYFLINYNFTWINCNENLRYKDMSMSNDWDLCNNVDLNIGDIIVIRFFKSSAISTTHSYLEKIIRHNMVEEVFKTESIISKEFIINNESLFINLTKIFERDKKISSLFKNDIYI